MFEWCLVGPSSHLCTTEPTKRSLYGLSGERLAWKHTIEWTALPYGIEHKSMQDGVVEILHVLVSHRQNDPWSTVTSTRTVSDPVRTAGRRLAMMIMEASPELTHSWFDWQSRSCCRVSCTDSATSSTRDDRAHPAHAASTLPYICT